MRGRTRGAVASVAMATLLVGEAASVASLGSEADPAEALLGRIAGSVTEPARADRMLA